MARTAQPRQGAVTAATAGRWGRGHTWVLVAALFTGGLGLMLVGIGLAWDSTPSREEKFGLSDLVDGSRQKGRILTPLEEARARIAEENRIQHEPTARFAISGTKLMLRAIRELDPRQREIRIQDTVRLLRKHPEAKARVYGMVDTYLANNPQMAAYGAEVKRAVERLLAQKPTRQLDFLDY